MAVRARTEDHKDIAVGMPAAFRCRTRRNCSLGLGGDLEVQFEPRQFRRSQAAKAAIGHLRDGRLQCRRVLPGWGSIIRLRSGVERERGFGVRSD